MQRTSTTQSLLGLATLFLLLVAPARSHAQASGSIVFSTDGFDVVQALRLGDDLFAGLDGAVPGVAYRIDLFGPAGSRIESVGVVADATGWGAPAPLWRASGVVGRDVGANPDPSAYHFERFEDAEDLLDGQVLQLVAVEASTGAMFATASLPLVAERSKPRYYFSDAAGFPRFKMEEGEGAFMTAIHLPPRQATTLTVFLLDSQDFWQQGAPLVDVRSQFPNGQPFTTTGSGPFTLELLYEPEHCIYGTILAPLPPGGDPPPFDPDSLLSNGVAKFPRAGTEKPWICLPCQSN